MSAFEQAQVRLGPGHLLEVGSVALRRTAAAPAEPWKQGTVLEIRCYLTQL